MVFEILLIKYLPYTFSDKLLHYIDKSEDIPPHEKLSEREFQVFLMIAKGKSLIEISRELSISIKTVSTYRARILEKLELENNAEIDMEQISGKVKRAAELLDACKKQLYEIDTELEKMLEELD